MAITMHSDGGISVDGKQGMTLYRMLTLKMGLSLETRTGGRMRLTRGPTCYSIVKREWGLRGNRARVLAAFTALCDERSAKVTRVVETEAAR